MSKPENPENNIGTVKILGRNIQIQLVSEEEMPDNDGEFCGSTLSIKVRHSLSVQDFHDTLVHECVHAALYLSGANTFLRHNVEECVVVAMTTAFASVIDLKGLNLKYKPKPKD